MSQHKRRTSIHNVDQRKSVTIALLIRDGVECHWCRVRFTLESRPTLDHLIPRIAGGPSTQENLVLACNPCQQKRANPPLGRRRTKEDGFVLAVRSENPDIYLSSKQETKLDKATDRTSDDR